MSVHKWIIICSNFCAKKKEKKICILRFCQKWEDFVMILASTQAVLLCHIKLMCKWMQKLCTQYIDVSGTSSNRVLTFKVFWASAELIPEPTSFQKQVLYWLFIWPANLPSNLPCSVHLMLLVVDGESQMGKLDMQDNQTSMWQKKEWSNLVTKCHLSVRLPLDCFWWVEGWSIFLFLRKLKWWS